MTAAPQEAIARTGTALGGLLNFTLVGLRPGNCPDLVRVRGPHWCPSVYRRPEELWDAYWQRVLSVASMLRQECCHLYPGNDGRPMNVEMLCSYGTPFVDDGLALHLDLLDATKWRCRRLMENPASSPEVQVQAASLLATLLLATKL